MNIAKEWTAGEQATLVRMAGEGARVAQIGAALGKSRNAVIGRAARTGVALTYQRPKPPPRPKLPRGRRKIHSAEVIAHVRSLYSQGVVLADIAIRTGVPSGSIPVYIRDLPRRRSVTWSTSRRDDTFRVTAVAATLAGMSFKRVAKRLGVSTASIGKWKHNPAILAKARAVADRIRAEQAALAEVRRLKARDEAAMERARIDRINAPVFVQMPARHRDMLTRRVSGQTLQEVADAHGVTRERVRQIEVRWRIAGLVVPGTRDLSAASQRMAAAQRPRDMRLTYQSPFLGISTSLRSLLPSELASAPGCSGQ